MIIIPKKEVNVNIFRLYKKNKRVITDSHFDCLKYYQ